MFAGHYGIGFFVKKAVAITGLASYFGLAAAAFWQETDREVAV